MSRKAALFVLASLGVSCTPDMDGAEAVGRAAALVPGRWSLVGSMSVERTLALSALLSDGRVLIIGGKSSAGGLQSCEIYDPTTETFRPTGSVIGAIDWASRGGLLANKPVATMSGSPGALGATKAQEHLRQICLHLGMYVLSRPTIAVPQFHDKIADGAVADEATRGFIRQQMETFYDWIVKLK